MILDNIYSEREFKLTKIKELYDKRKTQKYIADTFNMRLEDVGLVLREIGYSHTVFLRKGKARAFYFLMEEVFSVLDKYDISNFEIKMEIVI